MCFRRCVSRAAMHDGNSHFGSYFYARLHLAVVESPCHKYLYVAVFESMGIKNLLHCLKSVTVKKRLSLFEGLIAAVDASCWIHKAIAISYKQFGNDRR